MEPIKYVDALNKHYGSMGFPPYMWTVNDAYYDHSDAERDINCVFPIDRLREMAAAGEIDAVAPRLWSGFMGRIYNRTRVLEETGPAFVENLNVDGVDILLAVPA